MESVEWEPFSPNGVVEKAAATHAAGRARRHRLPKPLGLHPARRGKQGSFN